MCTQSTVRSLERQAIDFASVQHNPAVAAPPRALSPQAATCRVEKQPGNANEQGNEAECTQETPQWAPKLPLF